jgi:hypothetical protein
MADVSNHGGATHGTPGAHRCPDSRHCAPIEGFVRRTGVDPSTVSRYAWVHIGPIGATSSVVSVHWSDDDGPLDSRVMTTHRSHRPFVGLSLDLLGLTERPHAQARRMTFTIDDRPLELFVVAQYAWRDQHGLVAAWYARPSGRRIMRESDEHRLTTAERALMMHLEDLLLGHGRTGRKPRDSDPVALAEVDRWLQARKANPGLTWRDLGGRFHVNEDTIRKRCKARELEIERERADELGLAGSDALTDLLPDGLPPRQLPQGWVQRIWPVQSGRSLRPCQRG